jgi:glycine cleavage system H protein
MTEVMEGYYYTKSHEWVSKESDNQVKIGLTDYAQDQLTDIAYVELPDVGDRFERGAPLGVVESVKSSDEIMSPITGEVVDTNTELEDSPEFINDSPYASGWMILMSAENLGELDDLMTTDQYREYLTSL